MNWYKRLYAHPILFFKRAGAFPQKGVSSRWYVENGCILFVFERNDIEKEKVICKVY